MASSDHDSEERTIHPDILQRFHEWLADARGAEKEATLALLDNPDELEDSFYKNLAFGTGGLRGIIGQGPNRMNLRTVREATQGLADWLNAQRGNPSVAIARDSRLKGEEFVRAAAEVLAANGIKAMVYPRIEPTPALSFAVRKLECSAGICITASHNPAVYNGYKVYGSDGCQITTKAASQIQQAIESARAAGRARWIPLEEAFAEGLVSYIGEETIDAYIDAVLSQSHDIDCGDLKVAYTPLHGAGMELIPKILERINVKSPFIEPKQARPDGAFPTCPYPNPEAREALDLGLKLADSTQSDLLLASDPDADRLGVAVRHDGSYVLLSGNDIGILLLDFLCCKKEAQGDNLDNLVTVTTVVSTPMADDLARKRGFQLRRTLTGFKYIGEQIGILEENGDLQRFLFGFEESYGFLSGTHVRDKDAMIAALLVCEAAAWHKKQGRDLVDALDSLFERYGHFSTELLSFSYPGPQGAKKMQEIMAKLRSNPPRKLGGKTLVEFLDYRNGARMPIVNGRDEASQVLPKADVIELRFTGECKLIVRPSGTEPKIKAYLSTKSEKANDAKEKMNRFANDVRKLLSPE